MFGPKSEKEPVSASTPESSGSPAPASSSGQTASIQPPPFEPPPAQRRVVQAPILREEAEAFSNSADILIKAELSGQRDQLKLMVNRPLFAGYSWYFSDFESAAGSRLAEAVFSVDKVKTLMVQESTAIITRSDAASLEEWEAFARELGARLRETIESGEPLISDEIRNSIPAEDVVRQDIQRVIDMEVNPGVAGHGGRITLTKVEGNTVHIEMGGGCQGCSAADLTLKQGIHNSFRTAVPYIGAILDETDHTAGLNPFYS